MFLVKQNSSWLGSTIVALSHWKIVLKMCSMISTGCPKKTFRIIILAASWHEAAWSLQARLVGLDYSESAFFWDTLYIVAQNQAINGKRYRVQKNWVRTFHLGRIISTLFSMFRWSVIQKYFADFLSKRTKCSPAKDCECYGCVLTTSWMMMMMMMMTMVMMMICAFYFVEDGGNAWVSHLTPLSDSLLYADDYKYILSMKNIICPPKNRFSKNWIKWQIHF